MTQSTCFLCKKLYNMLAKSKIRSRNFVETVVIYADIIVLTSISVSLPALWGVCRAYCFRFSLKRVLAASLICGISTVAVITLQAGYAVMLLFSVPTFIIMILVSFGKMKLRLLFHSFIMLAAENVFLAGLAEIILNVTGEKSGYIGISGVIIGAVLLIISLRIRKSAYRISVEASCAGKVRLSVRIGNNTLECDALTDTGNLLSEPVSQAPVIILKKCIAEEHFVLSKNIRMVPYRTASGQGILECVLADEVTIKVKNVRFDPGDVYIGTSDNIVSDAIIGAEIISKCIREAKK